MRKKGSKNNYPEQRDSDYMDVVDIAKQLNISKTEVQSALKAIFRKFRKHMKNNNLNKEHYL
jgi:DNA-directed RNA polymerase specialized sigma24 family protein